MKLIIAISFTIVTMGQSLAQKQVSTIKLEDKITLTGTIETFDRTQHMYDTCDTRLDWKSICLIDGNVWFGSDAGMILPRNQLTRLTIKINKSDIELDISGMYNPSLNNELRQGQFKIKKAEIGYFLYGHFSDGAGSYTCHWKIINGKSLRLKISSDEIDFSWQTEK